MKLKFVAIAALVVGLCVNERSLATNTPRSANLFYSAVNVCQGPLASFEGTLRKRPIAVVNDGIIPIFVTCGVTTHQSADLGRAKAVLIFFHNPGAISAEVSCTLANDQEIDASGDQVFLVQTAGVFANNRATISFDQADNVGAEPFRLPGLSCQLPPGIEIEQVRLDFDTEV